MSRKHFHLTKSQKRQIDILSKSHKIIIEVDGYLHFNNVPQWNQLENIEKKDKELNDAVKDMGYMLVRISHSQWNNSGELNDDAREMLDMYLQFHSPSVNFIGPEYERVKMIYANNEQRFECALLNVASGMNLTVTELYDSLGDKSE